MNMTVLQLSEADSLPEAVAGAVVVGDDGSDDALNAVRWALADAERRSSRLVVMRAWSIATAPRPRDAERGYVPSVEEFAEAVAQQMQEDLSAAVADSAVDVILVPAHSSAEDALIEASGSAALTVVGARGRGLARWLGSVSTAVVRAARGPVAVVPGDRPRDGD